MLNSITRFLGFGSRDHYRQRRPLILVNGLAEQGESWYLNGHEWLRHFEVHAPGVLVYDGPIIQERLSRRLPITVDFLTDRLAEFLDNFVQAPPYYLVGSSLGGQITVEYAARHPEKVAKLVLLCPSGMGSEERLPITEGARHKDYQGLVESTFYNRRFASPGVIRYYEEKFNNKAWRKALFQTVRGTKGHSVREKLKLYKNPGLVICGREDKIVDSSVVQSAVAALPNYRFVMIPRCGHAPQIETASLVNSLVTNFLHAPPDPVASPAQAPFALAEN